MTVDWLDVYCWKCGEKNEGGFTYPKYYPKSLGRTVCPACGAILWVEKRDIKELKDRRERRGIPM